MRDEGIAGLGQETSNRAGIAGVSAFVLMRFGLLTHVAALFCYFVLTTAPTTLSFDAWFADTGLFALALVAGDGVFGFWASLRPERGMA